MIGTVTESLPCDHATSVDSASALSETKPDITSVTMAGGITIKPIFIRLLQMNN